MIKVYSMPSCPDCAFLKDQYDERFEVIDIGSHVKLLKEFMAIRDNNPLFEELKKDGKLGIPCFQMEDGTITLKPEDVGLIARSEGESCSIEDHKNGKKGC